MEKLSRVELITLWKARGLKGYSNKKHAELVSGLATDEAVVTKPRFIDLFCGLGAFHTAFAGDMDCVFACDIDEGVRKIYEANYGLKPAGDIRAVDVINIPAFDVLCAGFPCQPFSIAGNQEGFADAEKGNLFFEILRIIDAKGPSLCVLENVKNMKTHDGGRTFARIKSELEKRDYKVTSQVINAAEYGSPQARQRIFIIASRKDAFLFPKPIGVIRTVASILDDKVKNFWDSKGYRLEPMPSLKNAGTAVKTGKPRILYNIVSVATGRGGRQGERVYDVDAVGITVCASSGGIGAKTGLYKTAGGIRRLTVLEGLRMFGFPDTYKIAGVRDEDMLFYLGNSIVVDVVKQLKPSLISLV